MDVFVCSQCSSNRYLSVYTKTDLPTINLNGQFNKDDTVPLNLNLGDYEDAVHIMVCADCGHMVGKWPLLVIESPSSANKK
jgi:hypothetical protein